MAQLAPCCCSGDTQMTQNEKNPAVLPVDVKKEQ